jgi:diguanylate cyclase (GGDEF)-like protein
MRRPGVWVGRGLAVLGLAAVVPAVLQANLWALLAAVGGFLAATGLALAPLVRIWLAEQPVTRPSDFEHAIDLVRRAYGARAGWIVGLGDQDIEVVGKDELDRDRRRRGASIVQLASVDGRAHVAREPDGAYVAVGDFPFGAGLLLQEADPAAQVTEALVDELRRLVATMRLADEHQPSEQQGQLVAKRLADMAAGARTLEGVAKAAVELAQQFSQRGAAVVLPGSGSGGGGGGGGPAAAARVVAVSTAADSRLAGVALPADAPALRPLQTGIPVATHGAEDVFGKALPDRRRQDRAGTAYPVFDGHFVVGVLVLMGPPVAAGTPVAEQIQRLLTELGSRLAAARAVYEAEQRAVRDHLTGLRSRREFERALAQHEAAKPPPLATLVYADIDHFKRLNDTLGHPAGDAALRHIARILEEAVRDNDLVARIGGEEFAIWMPHRPIESGLEVAERIRHTVETNVWRWDGQPHALTLSCGVAAYPDPVRDIGNLRSTADAALYRAKQAGRNRVEKAHPSG